LCLFVSLYLWPLAAACGRVRSGGIAAPRRLYTVMETHPIVQHIPRLRRYARALVGDRYAADDLVQDTLERAWNKMHLWRAGSDMRAWLFAIMHNVFVTHARSRRYEVERN